MSTVTASSPTRRPAVRDAAASADLDRDRERGTGRSWVWTLVEALAYAGASFDPTAALAAQRFARVRDEELRRGR
jgi:hypothetical protein